MLPSPLSSSRMSKASSSWDEVSMSSRRVTFCCVCDAYLHLDFIDLVEHSLGFLRRHLVVVRGKVDWAEFACSVVVLVVRTAQKM